MTLNELSQLYYIKKEIRDLQKRLNKLKAASYPACSNISFTRSGGNNSKVEKVACEITDLENLISLNKQKLEIEKARIERYISSIEDSQIRQILRLRFEDGKSWQQVAFGIDEYDESYPRRKAMKYIKRAENAETHNV